MQPPKFLRETNYKIDIDLALSPWLVAHNTDQLPLKWPMSHPMHFGYYFT